MPSQRWGRQVSSHITQASAFGPAMLIVLREDIDMRPPPPNRHVKMQVVLLLCVDAH